ncbi:uncharacterized protein [Ptychodera flava]|uniref:uncharacterized protein isoform X2 n=1 Tax=Ptychodera flava TaxID=63121 RepID=UPI003969F765
MWVHSHTSKVVFPFQTVKTQQLGFVLISPYLAAIVVAHSRVFMCQPFLLSLLCRAPGLKMPWIANGGGILKSDEKIHGIQNRPILRTQKVENLQKCLQYLQSKGVRIYGVTADSLADGNLRTILTLLSAIKDKFGPEVKPHGNAFSQDSQGIETGDGYRQGTVSDKVGYNIAYIPGTMASSQSDNELPPTDKIMSTTQLDKRKVEQHGANQRRQQLVGSNSTNVGPQPENIASIAINQPVRETLSLTVEERLKSLLDSPDLGGLAQSSAKDYHDGELIQPPPPPARHTPDQYGEKYGDRRLITMSDETVRYGDGDWQHYGSYVPSHSEDKKEGPRVQRLLERQAPGSPTQKTSSVDVRMSPQSVHYKHAQTSSTSTNSSSLDPQSHQTQQRMPYWNSSDNLREACNILYNPAGNQQSSKQLPSYSEHLHRHPTSQQHWRDQSPNRPSDSGTVRQVLHRDGSPSHHHDYQSSPKRELQRKSQSLENSGSALRNDDTNPTRQNFESHASNSSTSRHIHSQHFRGQLHEQNQNRSDQHFRSAEGQQSQNSNRKQTNQTGGVLPMNRLVSQDSNYSTVSYNSITDSMTSSHTQMSFLTKLPSSIKTPRSHITGQMETSTEIIPTVREELI